MKILHICTLFYTITLSKQDAKISFNVHFYKLSENDLEHDNYKVDKPAGILIFSNFLIQENLNWI